MARYLDAVTNKSLMINLYIFLFCMGYGPVKDKVALAGLKKKINNKKTFLSYLSNIFICVIQNE